MNTKYELRFKTIGFPWEIFDTYKTKEDPELKKYYNTLKNTRFNDGVKIIEVKTIRTEVECQYTK